MPTLGIGIAMDIRLRSLTAISLQLNLPKCTL